MISFLSKYKRGVFIFTVLVFLVSIFFVSGQIFTASSSDAVADVGGVKLPYRQFLMQVNRALSGFKDSGAEVSDVISKTIKQEIFRDMVIEELMGQQATKLGLQVPDFEVAVEIQNTPAFADNGAFSMRRYAQSVMNEFHMSPSEYEAWRKKSRLAAKYKQFLYTSVKVTPEEVKAYYQAKTKSMKDFEKNKDKYADELSKEKFGQVANFMLQQIVKQIEIKSFLELREQGK